jgi:SAM-dependent methyltransferase
MLDPKGRVEGAYNSFAEAYDGIAGKSMTFFADLLIRARGDAEQLDFPESSFDLAISNQAFFFFPDKQKALNEVFRVLKPMGQTALLFFGEPSLKEVKEIYNRIGNRHTEYVII